MKKQTTNLKTLKEFPQCCYLKSGKCDILGVTVGLHTCTFCQVLGPFCGNPMSDVALANFKKVGTAVALHESRPKEERMEQVKQKRQFREGWQAAKDTWLKADTFLAAVKSRGYLATLAEAVGIGGKGHRVDEATYATRRKSCFGDENNKPCEMLIKGEKGSFCGACGCGERKLARLDEVTGDNFTKLHFPVLDCPLKRPGFSNASGE